MRKKQPRTMPPLPSSIPPERVSHTTIILEDEAVTSSRTVQLGEVPSVWVDRLLVATTELPFAAGQDAVVEATLAVLSSLLPDHALGACLVIAGGDGDAAQKMYRRVPLGGRERVAGAVPTRLFAGFAHERVFELGSVSRAGSTLHLACDHGSLDDDRSAAVHVAKRAAHSLGRAVDHAHAYAAAASTKRELTVLEAHAIQADKLASFGEMAAGLVHELNNPLTSIVAYSDYLLKKSVGPGDPAQAPVDGRTLDAEDVERLRRISESANRMLRFTRDLVSYARPSSELAVPVVVHTVVDQALAFCEHVLAEANAKVERRFDAGVWTVRGMPEQLTQVFVNLVTNACHAMPPSGGGIITVETRALEGEKRVRITVGDNGHGIASDHVKQVFAPFFTTKRDGRGTGLGLSIVRNIIELHGGTIHVESATGPASGTRFVIELPVGR